MRALLNDLQPCQHRNQRRGGGGTCWPSPGSQRRDPGSLWSWQWSSCPTVTSAPPTLAWLKWGRLCHVFACWAATPWDVLVTPRSPAKHVLFIPHLLLVVAKQLESSLPQEPAASPCSLCPPRRRLGSIKPAPRRAGGSAQPSLGPTALPTVRSKALEPWSETQPWP